MFGLQMTSYRKIFLNVALGDHSSMTILMLYSSFSGESMSSLLDFPSMEEYPGFCCPLLWSLRVSSMLVQALNTSFISEHLLKEKNGDCWGMVFPNGPKGSHFLSGHDIGLKNCFWGFENFILVTCISQLQKVIYNDNLWLGLMLNDPFCGITYQLRKISWFWVQFSHLVVHI